MSDYRASQDELWKTARQAASPMDIGPPFHTLATSMDRDGRRAHGDRRSLVARKFGDCREQPETLHSVDED